MVTRQVDTLHGFLSSLAAKDSPCSDEILLERVAARRDEMALAALIQRHGSMVRRVCGRVLSDENDTDDVFQASFLVLMRKAGELQRSHAVGPWLHRVAFTLALKVRRSKDRRKRCEVQVKPRQLQGPEAEISLREAQTLLDEALNALPDKYRQPLILYYLEGKRQQEVARQLKVARTTIEDRLERGRELLRAKLARRGMQVPALLLLCALPADGAAGVPLSLLRATTRNALAYAGGGLDSTAAVLAHGALRTIAAARAKLFGVVLAAVLGTGLGTGWMCLWAEKTEDAQAEARTALENPALDCHGDPLPPGALARLGTMRLRHHAGIVQSLAFTPNGKGLLTAGGDNLPRLWDAATGKLLHEFTSIPKPQGTGNQHHEVSTAVLSADGRFLAARSGAKGNLYLLDVATGKQLHEWSIGTGWPGNNIGFNACFVNFAFSPNSKAIAAPFAGRLELRDVVTGRALWQTRDLGQEPGQRQNITLAFSPDGRILASAAGRDGVRLWDAGSGKFLRELGDKCTLAQMSFSPDGRTLAVGGLGGNDSIVLWEVATGQKLRQLSQPALREPAKRYYYPVFSPAGGIVAARGEQGICLWDANTGKELRRWAVPFHWWSPPAFSPDGKVLAIVADPVVRFWDVATGNEQFCRLPPGHESAVNSVAFSADGQTLISAGSDHSVRWWDTTTGRQRFCLPGTKEHCRLQGAPIDERFRRAFLSALSPNRALVAATYVEAPAEQLPTAQLLQKVHAGIRLLDAATGREVRRVGGATGLVTGLTFSPDGKVLAEGFGPANQSVRVLDVDSGKHLGTVTGRNPLFFPDGDVIVTRSAASPTVVRFWQAATGKELYAIPTNERIECLALSPDGQLLATGGDRICLYRLSRRGPAGVRAGAPRPLAVLPGRVTALAFSPDGRMLASSGADHAVRVLETASGKERCRFQGHSRTAVAASTDVASLSFAPDGLRIASGSRDSTILIWDVAGRLQDGRLRPGRLSVQERERRWADLLADDAGQAGRALWALAADAEQSVPFLSKHLQTAAADSRAALARIPQLLRDLDSDSFPVREKAQAELEWLGEAAESALRQTLTRSRSEELRRRLEQLLKELEEYRTAASGEALRAARAVEILERIGTDEARQALRDLLKAAADSLLAQAAQAALDRLETR